ncbi:hypothetical protein Pan161_40390 [Gimesia algae]|uniref:RapA2 cadherin-like domain-containing protein n=1 Tax=Gimesia algae TaxID=2527971 RepID=A0A517VH83_9PLAN|nr:hypothetical protein Pan161_40390 [Gimesia algae]
MFGRKTFRKATRRLPFRISRPIGYASHVERLEDRTLLASNILASLESSVNQPNVSTELILNIGPGSSPTLGFEVHATAGSAFNPAAIQIINTSTDAVIPLNLAENDHAGTTNSLTLATLAPGEYSLMVRGQTAATGGFIVDVFLPGDTDGSGSVTDTEYQHALAATYQNLFGFNSFTAQFYIQQMGLNPGTNFYSRELDGDMDGDVDNNDLQMMNSNRNIPPIQMELIGDQDAPDVAAGLQVDSGVSNSDGITNELTIVGTVTDESLITQFKVSLDGGSYKNIFGQLSGGASGGSFTLDRTWLETNLNGGGSLEGGTHTLRFRTVDEHGNVSPAGVFNVNFELDTIAPTKASDISDQVTHEDFSIDPPSAQDIDLGPLSNYFNQNGGTPLSYQVVSMTEAIVEVDFSTGNLILNSVLNANGSTDIVIQAIDLAGNYVPSTFNVKVNALNDAPTSTNNTVTTDEDTTFTFTLDDFNYSDVEGDALATVQITSLETAGSLQLSGNDVILDQVITRADIEAGNLKFVPVADANGTPYDSFNFLVNDGAIDATASSTMTINVNAVNDAPTSTNNTVTTDEDITFTFTLDDFNFSDVDAGDELASVQITSLETAGSLQLNGADVILNQVITKADIEAGKLKFVPVADANGAGYASFDFLVNDGAVDATASSTMTVDVTAVNDAPTSTNNTVTTNEDITFTFTLDDFNFSDVDSGDELATVQITSLETAGSLQLNGADVILDQEITKADIEAGNLKFVPVADENGAGYASFDFLVNDGSVDATASSTMTVDVTAVNDAPTSTNSTVTTDEDITYTFTLDDFNFSDVDGGDELATVQIISLETVGALQLNGVDVTADQVISRADIEAGNLKFVPVSDASGTPYDSFEFLVNDGTVDATASSTMTINVDAVNDAPTSSDKTVATDEDTPYVFLVTDFAISDVEGSDLAGVRITSLPGAGTLKLSGSAVSVNDVIDVDDIGGGLLTFDPAENENGAGYASFEFKVNDGADDAVAANTMTIDVTAVNDAPTSSDKTVATAEDTPYVFLVTDFAISDVEGSDLVTVVITSLPGAGTLKLNGSAVSVNDLIDVDDISGGLLTFDPAENESGTGYASFEFKVNDGTDDAVAANTMTIDVTAVNDPPAAQNDAFDFNNENAFSGNVFLNNGNGADTDPDIGDSFNATQIEYELDPGVSGIETEPVTTIQPGEVTLQHGGVLTLSANGDFTYDPTQSAELIGLMGTQSLTETFIYTIDDGNGGTDTATVTIVISANQLPIAEPDATSTDENTPITSFNVLVENGSGADNDPDGDFEDLFVANLPNSTSDKGVSLTLNGDGTINYNLAGQFDFLADGVTTTDTFRYTLEDGRGGQSVGTVTVTITGVNDAPTSTNNTVTTNEDTTFTFSLEDFNFSDVDAGDELTTVVITSLETVGALQLNDVDVIADQEISRADIEAGNLKFVPVADASGTPYDSFNFLVSDAAVAATASSTMTINVDAVNDAPTSTNNTVTTDEDVTYTFTLDDFNFSDVDAGDELTTVVITSLETVGALQLNDVDVIADQEISRADIEAGNLKFVPVADASGTPYDSFNFLVSDAAVAATASSTMTINVDAVNDAPTSTNNTVTTNEDVTYTFTLDDFNFSDVDAGDELTTVVITSLETVGALQLNDVDVIADQEISRADIEAGNLKFVPVADASGTPYDSFNFLVSDAAVAATASSTMTINVDAVNDAPTSTNNTVTTNEDTTFTFSLEDFNYSDVEGAGLATVVITSLETVGALQLNGVDVMADQGISRADIEAGNLKFVPVADENGAGYDSFNFLVNDGVLDATASSTMTIDVDAVNDPVEANDDSANVSKNGTVNIDVLDNDVDVDVNDTLTVTLIDGQPIPNVNGDFVTLASGAIVTLEADGTLTYDPNGIHSDLIPPDTEPDSFEYTVSDGTVTDTATVNITISGSNEELTKTELELEDISSDGLTPISYDLDLYFTDPDPGDTVTYLVEAKLAGDVDLPVDFWANIDLSGSDLNITFTDYSSEQVRLPVVITVTAHSDDTLSDDVISTFTLTPVPQSTIDIQLIARNEATEGREFTSFRAESDIGDVASNFVGGGRFQLINGLQDLAYTISLYNGDLDIDGTVTDGDTTDDLVSLKFIDTANGNAELFTIFSDSLSDNDLTIDLDNNLLTGTWTLGEGLTSTIIDKLYAGTIAVQLVNKTDGANKTVKLAGRNIEVAPEVNDVNSLPTSVTTILQGDTYVVEIWMSDQLAQVLAGQSTTRAGITSTILDMIWSNADATGSVTAHFTVDDSAFGYLVSINDDDTDLENGLIEDINATTFNSGVASNGYGRLGYITLVASELTAAGDPVVFDIDTADFLSTGSDPDFVQRPANIDLSQISISSVSVSHVPPSEFFIQTDQSNLTVSGTITVDGQEINLLPQSGTLNATSLSGRLNVVMDNLAEPGSIRIVDSFVEVNPSGLARPDRDGTESYDAFDLADFGLVGDQDILGVIGPFDGEISLAIRDAIAKVFSSQQALDGQGYFDISEDWVLDHGLLESLVSVNEDSFDDYTIESEETSGETLSFIDPVTGFPGGVPDWSHARLTGNATDGFELLIPISRRLQFTTADGYDVVLDLVGSVTALLNVDLVNTDEAGDTLLTAVDTELNSGTPETKVYQGIIGNNLSLIDPLNDVDMFKVYLEDGDTVRVDVDASQYRTYLDSTLRLFDADGNQLVTSDLNAAPDEYIFDETIFYDSYLTYTAEGAGFYYIGLSSYANDVYDPEETETTSPGVFPSEVGSYDLTISVLDGAGVNPLHGTQSIAADTTLEEGTSVDLIVVREQTELNVFGQTEGLPDSDTWIDEWSSFWVEVYVETADAKGITDATVDLNYNTNFFTATAIEFGSAFNASGQAVIDDATGVVTGLSGSGAYERSGSGDKTLLARVKFESLVQDDVSIDFEDKFIGPHALGLSLSNVSVNLAHDTGTTLIVGDAPETDLWAIAYDVNDDDKINYRDLIILASIYGQNVLDADSPYVWALDADKSGRVDYRDLNYFASNYGVHKGGDQEVLYPSNFLQRWYGKTTDVTGESSIDQVMDEALSIWQDALGLEEPLDIQLVITNLGGTQLGEGQITSVDSEGRPVSGIVTLDDDAAGLGWYSDLDSSAFSETDLEGGVAYTADASSAAAGHYDLLTVLLHEIGHVLGFTDTYAPFESFIQTGVGGTLTFVGSGFEATLTDDGLHLDDTVHAGDVMNATLDPGVRKLPSILDALILQSAHEAAASGSYEILVGVNAPLMANLPLVAEPPVTQVTENENSLVTVIAPLEELSPVVFDVTSSQLTGDVPVQPGLQQIFNNLLQSQGLDQSELDLTVLEGLSDELINDLRLNGLSIVDSGKIDVSDLVDLETGDLDLAGLSNEIDADFDDVFSDWAGPIL